MANIFMVRENAQIKIHVYFYRIKYIVSLTDEWINKMLHVHTMECHSGYSI